MSAVDELRQRAESLLAMAMKARQQGQFDYAESLIAEATQFINEADAIEAARSDQGLQTTPPAAPDSSAKHDK